MKLKLLALVLTVLVASPAFANPTNTETKNSALPAGAELEAVTLTATVVDIDQKTRKVTLKGPEGKTETLTVGPEARNLDQVKKGDTVTFKYFEAVAFDVQKGGKAPALASTTTLDRAAKGSMPAGIVANTTTIRAEVMAVDQATRHMTLKGPQGNELTLKVGKDATGFSELKKGDDIVVSFTEAMAIAVTRS